MKRPLTLKEKLRVFYIWLKHSQDSLIGCCEYCKSTKLKRIDPNNFDHQEPDGRTYKRYKTGYSCLTCGALGWATETWSDNHLKNSQNNQV
jgi:uncharacterized protein with PIN domain